jgi:hypothetical protein
VKRITQQVSSEDKNSRENSEQAGRNEVTTMKFIFFYFESFKQDAIAKGLEFRSEGDLLPSVYFEGVRIVTGKAIFESIEQIIKNILKQNPHASEDEIRLTIEEDAAVQGDWLRFLATHRANRIR